MALVRDLPNCHFDGQNLLWMGRNIGGRVREGRSKKCLAKFIVLIPWPRNCI